MLPIQQPWMNDAAYRKGYERGIAASDPSRLITVNLSSFSVVPDALGIPRSISVCMKQSTSIHDVLTEIHQRLGDIQFPFSISTLGANSQELHLEDDVIISDVLPRFDADVLSLRLNVQVPKAEKETKKGLGSRLRSAFGSGNNARSKPSQVQETGVTEAPSSRLSMRSAPPPYEEATRSTP